MTRKKKPEDKKKVGRPTDYTQELAILICDRVSSSNLGLQKLCAMYDDMPVPSTIYLWQYKHPEFSDMYMQAKANQAHVLADECLQIADDDSGDTKIDPETGYEVCNTEFIARSRLRIDTRKWMAARLAPKYYGKAAEEIPKEKGDRESVLERILDKLVDK